MQIKKMIACWLGAAALLGLWRYVPAAREFFDMLDHAVFSFLNGTLAGAPGNAWAQIITFANTGYQNMLAAAFLTGVLLAYALIDKAAPFPRRVAVAGLIAISVAVFVYLRVSQGILDAGRASPSMAASSFNDMRGVYGSLSPKVAATRSFPSDHAIVFFLFAALLWRFSGRRWAGVVLAGAPLFLLPRLTVGSHWLSDMMVGSVTYVLIVGGILMYTPFLAKVADVIARRIAPVCTWLANKIKPYYRIAE